MRCVGPGAQAGVSSVTIEQPDKTGIGHECSHGGELGGIVIPPVTSGAAKGGQSRRGGQARPAEGEDASAGSQSLLEGLYVVMRRH